MRPDWLKIAAWTACLTFCLAFWITIGGCAMGLFRRGDLPEPAPKEVAGLGPAPGYQVKRMPSPAAVDALCRAWGVVANDAYVRRNIIACEIPALKTIVMPPEGALDPEVDAATLDHEAGHSRGYQHKPGGKGWTPRDIPMKAQAQIPMKGDR